MFASLLRFDRGVQGEETRLVHDVLERAQDDGHVYFRLNCLTRGDGTTPARPRSFRPEGVLLFAITGFVPNADKVAQPQSVE